MNLPYNEIDFSGTQLEGEELAYYMAEYQKKVLAAKPKANPDFTSGWYFGGLYWR